MKAIITGASQGIGGSIALMLAQEAAARGHNAQIVLTASGSKPEPEELIESIERAGGKTLYLTGDLAEAQVSLDIAARTVEFLDGEMDCFVSNAGVSAPAALHDLPLEKWDWMFNVNVRPTFILSQAFRPSLAARKGSITAVASMSGQRPHPGLGAYSAAKAALIMLCRQIAQEWAAEGIRANVVAPGMIRTPLTEKIYHHDEVRRHREALVPLGRIGTPEDIAGLVVFLASPAASYVTGEVLRADGGLCDRTLGAVPGLPKE